MNKETLRNLYLEKRKLLTPNEYKRRCSVIEQQFLQFLSAHPELKNIHIFLSMESQKEVNTWGIFEHLLLSKGHKVYAPKTRKKPVLSHHLMHSKTELSVNKWGISEPTNNDTFEASTFDLVLVPLLCFDTKGYRIGYGGGFYDKFLSECRPDCLKLGVSLAPPLDNLDYVEPHDIPLNMVLSHLGFDKF
ncbi:5-formyltetrahydrofolate cyclo-ligase [Roseivirga pacifica]|uniref:5-formyltetrahydrofolate cyclo-ligase n=1 Tax=Roseivirga pacifica TaxID=1267423 RepID=UPI003BB2055F